MEEKTEKTEEQKESKQNYQNTNKEESTKEDNIPKEKSLKTEMCQLIYYDFSLK